MTAAATPMTNNPAVSQIKDTFKNVVEGLGGNFLSHTAGKPFASKEATETPEEAAQNANRLKAIMKALFEMIANFIRRIIQGFKDAFMSKPKEKDAGPGQDDLDQGPQQNLRAPNDHQETSPNSHQHMTDRALMRNAGEPQPGVSTPSKGELAPFPTGVQPEKGPKSPGPAGAAAKITNDWVVEGAPKEAKRVIDDFIDIEMQDLDEDPIVESQPMALLSHEASQAAMVANAVKALDAGLAKSMSNPEVLAKLQEAAAQQDPKQLGETIETLLFKPALEDVEKNGVRIRESLTSRILETLKEEAIEDNFAKIIADAIVDGLPSNLVGHMLPPDVAERVTSVLEQHLTDIEALTVYNSIIGAKAAVFDGMFDPLKERQTDLSIFDQNHYKFTGKEDPQAGSNYLQLDRPRG